MIPETTAPDQSIIPIHRARSFGLDAVRASAILLVLAGHASFTFLPITHQIEHWVLAAYYGVELFFVLSGFLICGLIAADLQRGSFTLRTFWVRRWLRTLPNYYLFLMLNVLLERCLSGTWPKVWSYLIFMQCFAWPHPPFFSESWSLSFEEIFYLIVPIVTLVCISQTRWRVPILASLAICIAAFTLARIGVVLTFDPTWDSGVRKIVCIRLDGFIYGAAAMYWHHYFGPSKKQIRALLWIGLVGLFVSVILLFSLDRDHDFFARTFLFSLVLASLAALLPQAAEWHASVLSAMLQKFVRAISRWSYSIYLCQMFVLRILVLVIGWNAKTPMECFIEALVFMALSVVVAAFVYRFFEKPILHWRDQLTCPSPVALI